MPMLITGAASNQQTYKQDNPTCRKASFKKMGMTTFTKLMLKKSDKYRIAANIR